MKTRMAILFFSSLLAGAAGGGTAKAQSTAYRQTNLASSVAGAAANTAPGMIDPWGLAFLPGQPFVIVASGGGSISLETVAGADAGTLAIPSSQGATPTGLAADASGAFGKPGAPVQFVAVTLGGTILGFSLSDGKLPAQAVIERDDSSAGAAYTAVALVHPDCCAPYAAAADFKNGTVRTFTAAFERDDRPSAFQDPHLPSGYAPYGIEVIGKQIVVAYALRSGSGTAAVAGEGNGVLDAFDLSGNFVRRVAMGGSLNAPWGIALTGPNFGPFSGALLAGNSGDGTISAFDAANGNALGQLKDGDGSVIVNPGVRGLVFRADGASGAGALYFTAEVSAGQGGLLASLSPGLVSITRASANAMTGAGNRITATVAAGPGNSGSPTGMVMASEQGRVLATAPVTNGVAQISLPASSKNMQAPTVLYSGDANFLPSASTAPMPDAGTPDFSISTTPAAVTVSAGNSAQVTVTVTPSNGFASAVSFSCASVPGVTCSFNPVSVTPSGAAATTAMSINTTTSVPRYGFLTGLGNWRGMRAIPVVSLALLIVAWVWKEKLRVRPARVFAMLGGATVLALALALGGCGYGSSYMPPPQNSGPATVTVTAQSGSLMHTATVAVTVQ